jgi:hypothetical protein
MAFKYCQLITPFHSKANHTLHSITDDGFELWGNAWLTIIAANKTIKLTLKFITREGPKKLVKLKIIMLLD